MDLKNRTAIATGAASGIGRAIAVSLTGRGSSLALADIDEDGLVEWLAPAAYPPILERLRGPA